VTEERMRIWLVTWMRIWKDRLQSSWID